MSRRVSTTTLKHDGRGYWYKIRHGVESWIITVSRPPQRIENLDAGKITAGVL